MVHIDEKMISRKFVEVSSKFQADEAHFTGIKEIDDKINDIKHFPHLFVLACLMDKQIAAERAWKIPYIVCKEMCDGDFSFKALTRLTQAEITNFFQKPRSEGNRLKSLHRYNKDMSVVFYDAIQRINNVYGGDASKIWEGENSSAEVIYRFLCFNGCGIKIASMATNLLYRIFGIQYTNYSALDISPDIHVRRVMYRLGLVDNMDDTELIIYKARSINPEYPGLMDKCCWNVGRNNCHPDNPQCDTCPLMEFCPKLFYKGK